MQALEDAVDDLARRTGFSGVVGVDAAGDAGFATAYGLADRAHGIPNATDTSFGVASGTKALTALAVVGLIQDGSLALDTTARSVLGGDLAADRRCVTVEHLLRIGPGSATTWTRTPIRRITDHVMPVPVHQLATTEQFLAVLGRHPTSSRRASGSRTATAATSCSR